MLCFEAGVRPFNWTKTPSTFIYLCISQQALSHYAIYIDICINIYIYVKGVPKKHDLKVFFDLKYQENTLKSVPKQ